jgi:mRNA interferase YafQ
MQLVYNSDVLIETLRRGESRADWTGWRDCHISPDWLLIYKVTATEVLLARTGTHADLFGN